MPKSHSRLTRGQALGALAGTVAVLTGASLGYHYGTNGNGSIAPTPMPLISQGKPAYGEGSVSGAASNAVDNNYDTTFRCAPTCAIDVDLSSVPSNQRQQVLVSWYNDANSFYPAAVGDQYYNNPRDYTYDTNTGAGGGSPPGSGWTTIKTVTNYYYGSGVDVVNLNGANWFRMRITASRGSSGNTDASFNLDINDASNGYADSWLFLGDSITVQAMDHNEPNNFEQTVNASYPSYWPSEVNGGFGGWDSTSLAQTDSRTGSSYMTGILNTFPSHFVSLDMGSNDANNDGTLPADFTTHMTPLINQIIAAGRVAVIEPSIPWGCTSNLGTYGPTVNSQRVTMISTFAGNDVAGGDEWAFFNTHQSQISGDCLHPTEPTGMNSYRTVQANAAIANVYGH